jgi:hypothetical protein
LGVGQLLADRVAVWRPSLAYAGSAQVDSEQPPSVPRPEHPAPKAYSGLLLEEGPHGGYWRTLNECDCRHESPAEALVCPRLTNGSQAPGDGHRRIAFGAIVT